MSISASMRVCDALWKSGNRFSEKDMRKRKNPAHSHPENLCIARLDLLGLRQHRRRIRFEQLERVERRASRPILHQRVERAMRKGVDEHLLGLGAEHEALEQA